MNSWTTNNVPYYGQRMPMQYRAEPIHGESAAWQFPMGPNSEIYLPDAEEDIIWWIKTDMNGQKTVMPFDVKPHKKQETVTLEDIMARLGALEEKVNAKFNKSNAKRSATTDAAAAIE